MNKTKITKITNQNNKEIVCNIRYENENTHAYLISLIHQSLSSNIESKLSHISNNLDINEFDIECTISPLSLNKQSNQNNIYKINVLVYSNNELIGVLSKLEKNELNCDIFVNFAAQSPYLSEEDVNIFFDSNIKNFYLQTYITLGIESLNKTQNNIKNIFDHLKTNDIFSVKNSNLNKINIEYIIGQDIRWSLVVFDNKNNSEASFYYDIDDNCKKTIVKSMIDCNIINQHCIDEDILNSSIEDIFSISNVYSY